MSSRVRAEDLTKDQLVKGMLLNQWHLPMGRTRQCDFTKQFLLDAFRGKVWLPRSKDVKKRICYNAPVKEVLFQEINHLIDRHHPGKLWPNSIKRPNKQYLLEVLATLDFHNEVF